MSKPSLHLYRPPHGSSVDGSSPASDSPPASDSAPANDSASVGANRSGADRRQRELDRLSGAAEAKSVTVSLATIIPLLVHAAEHNRAWLKDFADDVVRIDADLYDVLLAYQQLQQRAVA